MTFDFDSLKEKITTGAEVAIDAAEQLAKSAKKSVQKTIDVSTLNTQIKNANVSIHKEYAKIGELVYRTHLHPETSSEDIDGMLNHIDMLHDELRELKEERDRRSAQ